MEPAPFPPHRLRSAFVLLALLGTAHADVAAPPSGAAWGPPRVVLTSYGHQGGKTRLLFALFDGRKVLYRSPDRSQDDRHLMVELTSDEERTLLEGLAIERVGVLQPRPAFGDDGATRCIIAFEHDQARRSCGFMAFHDDAEEPALLAIWRRLAHFSSPRATPWVPERVQVTFGPYDSARCGAPPAGYVWPKGWPLPRAGAVGDETTVDLTRSALPTLEALRDGRTKRGCASPVRVDGRWLDFWWTVRLPYEERWVNGG